MALANSPMSILTSLLFVLTGLALIVVLLRARPASRAKRLVDWEEGKMEIGAKICEAAARDAFHMNLDHTDESLTALDELIATGWSAPSQSPMQEIQTPEKLDAVADSLFVLASYLGDVLVRHHNAQWRMDDKTHRWPYLFFSGAELAASPFDIIEKKLAEPKQFSIVSAKDRLLTEVERRKNMRATSWSTALDTQESDASFGPIQEQQTSIPEQEASVPEQQASASQAPIEPIPHREILQSSTPERTTLITSKSDEREEDTDGESGH